MSKHRLTQTQRIILSAAASHLGLVRFGPGDRKGTRIARRDEIGVPVVIAYQTPQVFLAQRGLLVRYGNDVQLYRITDAGREALDHAPALDRIF